MKQKVNLKVGNVLSNSIVANVAKDMLLLDDSHHKNAKSAVDDWLKYNVHNATGDAANVAYAVAYRNKVAADIEYLKQVSYHVNLMYGANNIVTDMINNLSQVPGSEFFTADYLNKLGIYEIPVGRVLDTPQKCISFVSSLYNTALCEYKKEVKDGGGIEVVLARCKEAIAFNDSQFINTKFDRKTILRKCEMLYGIISGCTKAEKVAVWAKLGVRFAVKDYGKRKKSTVGDIPILATEEVSAKVEEDKRQAQLAFEEAKKAAAEKAAAKEAAKAAKKAAAEKAAAEKAAAKEAAKAAKKAAAEKAAAAKVAAEKAAAKEEEDTVTK